MNLKKVECLIVRSDGKGIKQYLVKRSYVFIALVLAVFITSNYIGVVIQNNKYREVTKSYNLEVEEMNKLIEDQELRLKKLNKDYDKLNKEAEKMEKAFEELIELSGIDREKLENY